MWRDLQDRPRLRDAAVAVAFFALGIILYVADFSIFGSNSPLLFELPRWVALVTLAIACVAQSFRSTAPGWSFSACSVIVGIDLLIAQSLPVWLVFSDVVYAVALYAGSRTVRALYATVGATIVVVIATVVALDGTWRTMVLILLWILALVISPIGYGRAIAEHRNAAESERARAQAVSELADRQRADAVTDERRHLARDLHDVIAGHLSGIALQSAAALRAGPDSPITAEVLASIRGNSVEALSEMRTMIDVLGGTGVQPHGDPDDRRRTASLRRLDHLVATARTAGSPVTVQAPADPQLPAAVDVCAYRIMAEALNNATNHAPAQPISIEIDTDDAELTMSVTNALGPTMVPRRNGTGLGLINMGVRAESSGGSCVGTRVGDQWVVTASLPIPDRAAPGGAP